MLIELRVDKVRERITQSPTGKIDVWFCTSNRTPVKDVQQGFAYMFNVGLEELDHWTRVMHVTACNEMNGLDVTYWVEENRMKCPMCSSKMTYGFVERENKKIMDKTHAYCCTQCPAVVVEWYDQEDAININKIKFEEE